MPAGTYDIALTNGTLDIGNGVLPALPVTSATTFTLPLAGDAVSAPIGLTVADAPFSVSGGAITASGTATVTVISADATVTPATGSATINASFFAVFSIQGTLLGVPASGTCGIGSQAQPLTVHLTTDQGSAWDPATSAFSMADKTFEFPAPNCGVLGDMLGFILGSTGSGNNTVTMNGTATRQPDPAPTTTTDTPPPPPASTGNPAETTPLTAPVAKGCVVPKLAGKKLAAAKKSLKAAGCKVGKVKSKNSKKKKKGRVIAQGRKSGSKLPAGTKVPLTVSKGPKKTRKHR